MFPKVAYYTWLVRKPAKANNIRNLFIINIFALQRLWSWSINLMVTSFPVLSFYELHQLVVNSTPMGKEEPTSRAEIHIQNEYHLQC